MTVSPPPTDTDRLAEALADFDWRTLPLGPVRELLARASMTPGEFGNLAAALAPVVSQIAARHAAEELRALAKDLRSGGYEPYPEGGFPHFACEDLVASHVEQRADALAGEQ